MVGSTKQSGISRLGSREGTAACGQRGFHKFSIDSVEVLNLSLSLSLLQLFS